MPRDPISDQQALDAPLLRDNEDNRAEDEPGARFCPRLLLNRFLDYLVVRGWLPRGENREP